MSAELRISLNNIRNVKNIFIEGLGAFTVRKLGAGEELDLSDKMRRLSAIFRELQSLQLTDEKNPEALKEAQDKAETLSAEVAEIQRFELDMYKRCFEDDNDGKNVEKLLNSLSIEERSNLFKSIFNPLPDLELPEATQPGESQKAEDVKEEKPKTGAKKNG